MRRLGINVGSFRELEVEEQVPYIAAAGFDSVFFGYRGKNRSLRIAELVRSAGLDIDTLHAPFSRINDIWAANADGDAMLSRLFGCVDTCSAAGVPVAVVHLSSGEDAPHISDVGIERFTRLVEYAGEREVKIAFENQRKLANLALAFELFGDLPQVGFCWDVGHEACIMRRPVEFMTLFGDKLCCLHIHDNRKIFGCDEHMIPFDGGIDFSHFAEHIRKSGFGGTLMLEVLSTNSSRYEGYTPERYFEQAYSAAKRLRTLVDGE